MTVLFSAAICHKQVKPSNLGMGPTQRVRFKLIDLPQHTGISTLYPIGKANNNIIAIITLVNE